MPSMFDPITLKWEEREYVIPSDKIMDAIARIEEHVTMEELHLAMQGKGIKRVDLSRAFGSVLRFAGANVTDEEIYAGMFNSDSGKLVLNALLTLLAMMVPPSVLAATMKEGESAEKKGNRQARRAAKSLSKPRIRRQLSSGISPPPNSGV